MNCVTMSFLAKRLGVSTSTVSRSLRDHPAISETTKEKVVSLAEQYNYRSNRLDKGLRTRSSSTIGVIVPEIRHDFFSRAICGIEDVAGKAGYGVVISQSREKYDLEVSSTRNMILHRVAGLILSLSMETSRFEHLTRAMQQNIPVVLFDRVTDKVPAHKVVVDDFEGARMAVEYLIGKGYRRIAHLAGPGHVPISLQRLAGYWQALEDNGLTFDWDLVAVGGFQEEDGRAGMEALMKGAGKPDAVFAVNDPVALGALSWLKGAGLSVPQDLGLVGFSNNSVTELMEPALTTVEQPARDLGVSAAELLLDQLRHRDRSSIIPVTKVLETRLVVRGSA